VTRASIPVVLETTPKKSFANAVDWPGWSRSGKTEDLATEALAAYAERYRAAIASSGYDLPDDASARLNVIGRIGGDASTEFGVPGAVVEPDRRPTDRAEATRLAEIVEAAWRTFDRTAAAAPRSLRKGPRGGGRDTAKIVDHVIAADHGYAREMGIRMAALDPNDADAVATLRKAMLDVLRRPSDGSPLTKRWTARYAARRIAWHALDHAWEIEDRTEP
jgi:hypothetical protein